VVVAVAVAVMVVGKSFFVEKKREIVWRGMAVRWMMIWRGVRDWEMCERSGLLEKRALQMLWN